LICHIAEISGFRAFVFNDEKHHAAVTAIRSPWCFSKNVVVSPVAIIVWVKLTRCHIPYNSSFSTAALIDVSKTSVPMNVAIFMICLLEKRFRGESFQKPSHETN
jgi:hypothetical protein